MIINLSNSFSKHIPYITWPLLLNSPTDSLWSHVLCRMLTFFFLHFILTRVLLATSLAQNLHITPPPFIHLTDVLKEAFLIKLVSITFSHCLLSCSLFYKTCNSYNFIFICKIIRILFLSTSNNKLDKD